jgi:hypothetical protein
MLPTCLPEPTAAAVEAGGNSTLILLLMAHLHDRGLIDTAALAAMVEQAERNTLRDTPILSGSAVVEHALAWLHAQTE